MVSDIRVPVYQTSIALNLALAVVGMVIIFNGPQVGC
jgi:hypothetical protein